MTFSDVPVDQVQKYWDDRPCNIRHSLAPVGTLKYFNEVARRKYTVEPHILPFADFYAWQGKKVLEIGCGIGTDTISFARAGAKVTAVDLSSESLALAQQRASVYGLNNNIIFYQANAEELSEVIPRDDYDLVYSFGVLHHTPNPKKAFEEIGKVLAKRTQLKLMVYNKLSWKAFRLTYGRLWDDKAIAKQSEAQTGSPVTYSYTKHNIGELLSPFFKVDKVEVDHIFPYKLDSYIKHEDKKFWFAKTSLFPKVEKIIGWHLLVDAHSTGDK